ncbi:mechanosensitive ion channel domain-containing protein [Methylibium sp.]|uniref:mechanosensitive ion channel family protein n=1 Tax=Methylibium sp. TaxID=2067992 RepID=UPI00286AC87C|nr:mechanosensitive ion channel domain-containing protein [Methylibium sp.]
MARPMTPDELGALGRALLSRDAAIEFAVLLGCLALAWLACWLLRGRAPQTLHSRSVLFGERLVDGALFPLLAFGLALLARELLPAGVPPALLRIAIALLFALAIIRLVVRVLRAAFPESQLVRIAERWVSWVVWIGLILWITGVLPLMLDAMEGVSWKVGSTRISLRALFEGAFNAVVVLVLALWVSAAIETRLLKNRSDNLSVRKMAANATRALLLLVGLLLALSVAGIDLTALSVLGGALGVGLGLGLQKLASNYVSGFVILAERSLRIGDLVKVDGFEGRITDINTRATVIRAASGRESIVPNELLITQRVENATFADKAMQHSVVVKLAHGADIARLRLRLLAALAGIERVMSDEGHATEVHLSNLLADGLELTVWYWVGDPPSDLSEVRSQVNLGVLAVLEAEGQRPVAPAITTPPG